MNPPDLTMYRLVHHGLRRGAHRLAAGAAQLDIGDRRQVKAFASYWDGFAGELTAHHKVEDDFFFPALIERVAVAEHALAGIEGDHDELDRLIAKTADEVEHVVGGGGTITLCRLLEELDEHLDRHLGIEDDDILPLFERHFSAEEYAELDEAAIKSLGVGSQALFTVPFIAEMATPPQLMKMLIEAPLPMRVVYRLGRRRYARMVTRAFGHDEMLVIDLTESSQPVHASV